MSKYVKDLVTNHLKQQLTDVNDMLLLDIAKLDAIKNSNLRRDLRAKNLHLMVVKNSLARRATEGTVLAPAFDGAKGSLAMIWGAQDIVALAKVVAKITEEKQYANVFPRGGVMGGAPIKADEIKAVSKWPSREEQLSLLVGQILSPGAKLASQLKGAGGALVSQIKQLGEEKEGGSEETTPASA
jgi:large subunit ribosomal protein L10